MTEPTPDAPSPAAMPAQRPGTTPEPEAAAEEYNFDDLPAMTQRDIKQLRNENQNLRRRLRDSEASTEQATTHLGNMRRAEVERVAAAELIDPADLWSAHDGVDGFLTENGTVDAQAVTEAAQSITAAKPHLAAQKKIAPPPSERPLEGLRPGARPEARPTATTWADALRR